MSESTEEPTDEGVAEEGAEEAAEGPSVGYASPEEDATNPELSSPEGSEGAEESTE
jgi:hypothetical protein